MKVSGNPINASLQNIDGAKSSRTEAKKNDANSISSAATALGDTAKVAISDRAQAMQRAKEIAGEDSVDEAKVAKLQKLIDEGKYSVNASAVADRLVDQHLMFPD